MVGRKFLLGILVLVVMTLGVTGVAACDGGDTLIPFTGNVLVKDFKLTDGNNTVDFNGLVNIDVPWINETLIKGIDTVLIKSAVVQVSDLTPLTSVTAPTNELSRYIQKLNYMDLSSADVIPMKTPGAPICDDIFGYALIIDEALVTSCSYLTPCPKTN